MTGVPNVRVLDADIVIDMQHRHPAALAWFGELDIEPFVSGIAVMELYQGAQNRHQEREVEMLISPLPIAWPTEADCRRALLEFRAYHLSHSHGLLDALIAATTIGLGATLCIFNVKHYRNISGIALEQPYVR